MVTKCFKTHNTSQLLFLTGAATEVEEGNGKHEHETIELLFHEVATNAGDVDQAPVVMPDLAKKIVTLHFAGTNMDNLSDGSSLW